MKYIYKIIYIIFFLFLLTCSSLFSYTNIPIQFNKNETLIYDITVFNIKVAEQKTIIKDIITLSNRRVYYIYTTIDTAPVISKLFRLNDVIETYIDTETYLPILIKTKISEGKWNNEIQIIIDHEKKTAIYEDKFGKKEIQFNDNFFGLISLLYFVRTIKSSSGEIIEFTVHNKRKKQNIKTQTKYINKPSYISALKKKVKSIKFEGIDDKKANLWITNDKYRVPYRFISIRIPVMSYGYITFINKLKYYNKGIKE